jgi:hypothetical protein
LFFFEIVQALVLLFAQCPGEICPEAIVGRMKFIGNFGEEAPEVTRIPQKPLKPPNPEAKKTLKRKSLKVLA